MNAELLKRITGIDPACRFVCRDCGILFARNRRKQCPNGDGHAVVSVVNHEREQIERQCGELDRPEIAESQ